MVSVLLFEGDIRDDQVIDELEMNHPPQVGDTLTVRIGQVEAKFYKVVSIDHLIEVSTTDGTIRSCCTGIRCGLEPRF